MIDACPCGSENSFQICCEPFINEQSFPLSAEQLMRSRYSAYVKGAIDYLIHTTHSSTRNNFSRKEIEKWSGSNEWLGLEIIESSESTVEFKATFVHGKNLQEVHHEKSSFVFERGRWYYVDGEFFN